MWIIKVFVVISLTSLCAAQDLDEDVTTQPSVIFAPTELPVLLFPVLSLDLPDGPIYAGESVRFSCDTANSSPDWTYLFFCEGKPLPSSDPSSNSLTFKPTDTGTYWCQVKLRGETSKNSNAIPLSVTANKPKPTVTQTPKDDVIYTGESVTLSCGVEVSTGWQYLWYRNGVEVGTKGNYLLNSPNPSDGGRYTCRAKRGQSPFFTDESETITLTFSDLPKPSVKLVSHWLDVFEEEELELRCDIIDSEWKIIWQRNGQVLKGDDRVFLEDSALFFQLPSQADQGLYTCRAEHLFRNIISELSDPVNVTVYGSKPRPTLSKDPGFQQVYVGESVTLTCRVDVSSGWGYLWFKDGKDLDNFDTRVATYTISSPRLSDSGQYSCKAVRNNETVVTDDSEKVTLDVVEIPVPSLNQKTGRVDVFPSESVKLSCGVQGNSDWTYTWYKDDQKLQAGNSVSFELDGAVLSVQSASASHGGQYQCQGRHKSRSVLTNVTSGLTLTVYGRKPSVTLEQDPSYTVMYSGESLLFRCHINVSSGWEYVWFKDDKQLSTSGNTHTISSAVTADSGSYKCRAKRGNDTVFFIDSTQAASVNIKANKPKPSIIQNPDVGKIYNGESMSFQCGVQPSSGWEYLWYKDGVDLLHRGSSFKIPTANPSHSGIYQCMARRGRTTFSSESSDMRRLLVSEIPVPSLNQKTAWLDVFPSESVKLSCGVQGNSDWTYTWYKDDQKLQAGNSVSFELDGAVLSVQSASASHGGQYQCQGRHKSRSVLTNVTSGLTLTVYGRKPSVTLEQDPSYTVMYSGESLLFRCHINVSSGWEYVWFKDDKQLSASGNTHTISSAVTAGSGSYKCRAKRGNDTVFFIDSTQAASVNIKANKPKPSIIQNPDVGKIYNGESMSFQCGVQPSSGWEYLWYKDGVDLLHRGSSFKIPTANASHSGIYQCMARRGRTTFSSESSDMRRLLVSEIPVPSLNQKTAWLDVFPFESVKLSCGVQGNSDWTYTWYKDDQKLQAGNSVSFELDGAVLSVQSASASHGGQYQCQGQHKSRSVLTNVTSGLTLTVYAKEPSAELKQDPSYAVMYTGDSLLFSCHINVSSGWEYVWFKDDKQLSASGNTHTISSAVTADSGSYKCRAKRGPTVFYTDSQAWTVNIEVRPWAAITLLTGWSEVFSTDSLKLSCEVIGSGDQWNFTWFKEVQNIDHISSHIHLVTPQNDPEQSLYACQGVRAGRPNYSTKSAQFKTKYLLMKRRVLLSISGCIFFGLIAVFIGSIYIRVTRKPVAAAERIEEPNLFLTMAELKARDDAPNPLVEYITDAALIAPCKDVVDDDDQICSELTPLPITPQEGQAVTTETPNEAESNGLISFK
ncbi:basement membrane-specific heparan sulfate proteoglycan core protein isoform X2 [Genypterus blacodes]|uniref:basement membrane-specific heparan sulfate proteoglycan core protein isoform X2 n=1 Tax=Genypterus blacodes TaxID=154954 RepID=UPI003F771008